MYDSYDVLSVT